jgi:hypothetical protein
VSTIKCQKEFRRKFPEIQVPHRSSIGNLVNKIRKTGVLIGRKPKCHQVLTELYV